MDSIGFAANALFQRLTREATLLSYTSALEYKRIKAEISSQALAGLSGYSTEIYPDLKMKIEDNKH